jgi:hypothetical protein
MNPTARLDPTADSVAYGTHCREESDRTVVSDQSDKRPVSDTAESASEQPFGGVSSIDFIVTVLTNEISRTLHF